MATDKLNKVLNRPLFRQQALKKGDLKPVRAQFGTFVGTNPMGPKGTMVGQPYRNFPLVPAGPVVDRTPGIFQKGLGAIQRNLQGIGEYLTDPTSKKFVLRPRNYFQNIRNPLLSPYGLYTLGRDLTGSETVGGIASLGAVTPIGRGIGMAKNIYDVGKYVIDPKLDPKTNVLSTRFGDISNFMPQSYYGLKEARQAETAKRVEARKKRSIENLLTVPEVIGDESGLSYGLDSDTTDFKYMSKEQQNKVIGQNAKKLAREANIDIRKAANIISAAYNDQLNLNQATAAVQDDVIYAQTTPNKYKDPNISLASTTIPQAPEASEPAFKKPEPKLKVKVDQPKKLGDGKIDMRTPAQPESASTTYKGITSDLVKRAKEIYAELGQGRSSNANLVFLANLATGLLSGKTSQSGVGGALEVLGNALGPAVTNYSIIKLKENEIENKLMGDAIDAASKEFALVNKAKTNPKGGLGRAQFVTDDGKYVNFESIIGQDGIVRIQTPEGLVQVAPGTSINLGGQKLNYVRAVKKDTIGDEEQKSIRALGQRVKSLNVLYDAKDIIIRTRTAGAKGKLSLLKSRLGSALSDFGGGSLDGLTEGQSRNLEEQFNKAIENSDMTDEKKKELRKKYGFERLKDKAKKDIKKYLGSETITSDELEKLAVAEVTLTYALANSFKDTDRLTQRDIDAADRVVGIFPLLGGSGTVLSKLNSLETDLLRDVKNLETKLRQQHFVVESAITNNLKELKGYQESKPIKRRKITKEEIEGIFKNI